MTISLFLIAWFALSVPAGMLAGAFIRAGSGER